MKSRAEVLEFKGRRRMVGMHSQGGVIELKGSQVCHVFNILKFFEKLYFGFSTFRLDTESKQLAYFERIREVQLAYLLFEKVSWRFSI